MRPKLYQSYENLNPYLKKINAMLVEMDLTPTRISMLAGLGVSTLANLIKRNNVPTIATLDKLCAVFGMPLSSFILELEIEYPELSRSSRFGLYQYDPALIRKNRLIESWAALPVGDRHEALDRMYKLDAAQNEREASAAAGDTANKAADDTANAAADDTVGDASGAGGGGDKPGD